jgi:hypothetical protein
MATYPFTLREQDAVRAAGEAGFRYESETKKAIRFRSVDGEILIFNREFSSAIAFVFEETKAGKYLAKISSEKFGPRASSNFDEIGRGLTRNGNENNSGTQIQFADFARVREVLSAKEAGAC